MTKKRCHSFEESPWVEKMSEWGNIKIKNILAIEFRGFSLTDNSDVVQGQFKRTSKGWDCLCKNIRHKNYLSNQYVSQEMPTELLEWLKHDIKYPQFTSLKIFKEGEFIDLKLEETNNVSVSTDGRAPASTFKAAQFVLN